MAVKKTSTVKNNTTGPIVKKVGRPKKDIATITSASTIEENFDDNIALKEMPSDEINFDSKEVINAIENVDTTIKSNAEVEATLTQIKEAIEPIEKIKNEMSEIQASQSEFNKKITETPEKAEEIISQEMRKSEDLKAQLEKSLEKIKPSLDKKTAFPTQWWNGVNFGF